MAECRPILGIDRLHAFALPSLVTAVRSSAAHTAPRRARLGLCRIYAEASGSLLGCPNRPARRRVGTACQLPRAEARVRGPSVTMTGVEAQPGAGVKRRVLGFW